MLLMVGLRDKETRFICSPDCRALACVQIGFKVPEMFSGLHRDPTTPCDRCGHAMIGARDLGILQVLYHAGGPLGVYPFLAQLCERDGGDASEDIYFEIEPQQDFYTAADDGQRLRMTTSAKFYCVLESQRGEPMRTQGFGLSPWEAIANLFGIRELSPFAFVPSSSVLFADGFDHYSAEKPADLAKLWENASKIAAAQNKKPMPYDATTWGVNTGPVSGPEWEA